MKYKYTKAYDHRGAAMGRPNHAADINTDEKFYLQQVQINSQGYDPGGAYWGIGESLYVAFTEDAQTFVRAQTRDQAKEEVKKLFPYCRFYR